jgi:PTH1 family peptidyl-tRNA hydrolase
MAGIEDLFRALKSKNEDQETFLIVGLGNPGREYRDTRHNIGFIVLDQLAKDLGITIGRMQSKALIGKGEFQGNRVVVAKPQTFMNLSGQAVSSLMKFYKLPVDHLLVIHDDLDLPFGSIRIRPAGGSAGQKGLHSIIERMGTKEFPRMRMGIGRPPGKMDAASYVLRRFSKFEQDALDAVLPEASKAIQVYMSDGLERAMNQFNGSQVKG